MFKKIFFASLIVSAFSFFYLTDGIEATLSDIYAITNCSGTQVVRVSTGKFEVRYVDANLPGCRGDRVMTFNTNTESGSTVNTNSGYNEHIAMDEITNCNGLRLTSLSNGRYYSTRVAENLPGCIDAVYDPNIRPESPRVNLSNGPLLDLASTDIVNYRNKLLKDQGVRFADVIRSVRMRRAANMQAKTTAYLMNGDAVVVSGEVKGWTRVQWTDLVVTDLQENIVTPDIAGKATGYTAGKYLRDPNVSDLVRIKQADQAYWSDIAHVNVAYMVNVRSHPWHTASIVTTLGNKTPLYIVSIVDNWSEVRNDDDTIHGYIRSNFLVIDKSQRVGK
jgi:hypothetical protein